MQPDAGQAESRGAADVRFRAVADDPGAGQAHPDLLRGEGEDARVGLADAGLLGNHPVGDITVQAGAADAALGLLGGAVRDDDRDQSRVGGDLERATDHRIEPLEGERALVELVDEIDGRHS